MINIKKLISEPGLTYQKNKQYSPENSFILTQNIDGLADSTGLDTVEIHLRGSINKFDNVVLLGHPLPNDKITQCYKLIARTRPQWVLIIGTSMYFPYLRVFINKAKARGAKVFHINPDENYDSVKKNEIWIKSTASEGLDKFFSDFGA